MSPYGVCAPAHAYGINYYIVDLVCQVPLTAVLLAPELCSSTPAMELNWETPQNYLRSKYLVKGTGEKAGWADERYSPNEGNPVQMKRSPHLQALGTAGIIIPRFKR